MTLSPSDDKLPESFFTALYPDLDLPEPTALPLQGERLARLVEHWPGAVFGLDSELNCHLINREARAWCLLEPPQELPHPLHEMLSPDMIEALLPYLSAALRGMEMAFDDEFDHPTQGRRALSVRVQPDHEHHQVVGVFLHLFDVTDVRATTELAEDQHHANWADTVAAPDPTTQEAHLRLMAEGLRDTAIFFLDPHGLVCDWTPSAQRLLGHSSDEALGQNMQHFAPPDAPDGISDAQIALERAALLGQSESSGWHWRADGSRFWAHTAFTVLHDEHSGEALGFSCLMRDMTEVKRLEDMLRELNQDLESFSYSVSHDLRAPLRHISSFVDMLREDLGSDIAPAVRKHLDTIAQAAQHMGQLIEGLLAFSRMGRAPLTRRDVAMGALLQSSVNRVQHDPALQRPADSIQWHLPTDLPTLQGDGLLLSQVWDNLLANALKYSRPRAVVEVTVGWQTGAPGETIFWVRDNGVGFDPRRASKLFGVFQRLHRASEFEGTGIGLALCRRIVERHGGRIWAESTPGEGSTFYFALPSP